jgi:glycosyltransferase involved in cell wall biosynthesis
MRYESVMPLGCADVEFSLALNNRTGKYFVCRELLDSIRDIVGQTRYWRTTRRILPSGFEARVLGRLLTEEIRARARWRFANVIPRMSSQGPVIFTDPLEVLLYDLKGYDLVVCHDMGPLTHPHFYDGWVENAYKKAFAEIAQVKPHLAFVSASSKAEYEGIWGAAYTRAQIVYPSLRIEASHGPETPLPNIQPPFLLTVGAVGSRKNQEGAITAFGRAQLAAAGWTYVVCGGPEPGFENVKICAGSTPGVVLTGYVSDAQLRWLYVNAEGFVLPSHLEGFGVPAAEAISRGLVPLVGRGGALEEISGQSAILVDPEDTDSISAGLIQLTSMTQVEKDIRLANLRAHIQMFTPIATQRGWQAAAEAALNQYYKERPC